MPIDRVNYGDTRVYINNTILKGVSDCSIETTREVENLRSITRYETPDRILKSNQVPKVTISWILGEESTDPFFDFQNSGILSVENFEIKKRDIAGVHVVNSGFLTSYSVNASVGDLITAEAQYEGLGYSFADSGKLTIREQTADSYRSFLPSKISLSATFAEGDIFKFPIQSFSIDIPTPRTPLKRLGEMTAKYMIPTLPSEATVSFSAVKNDITGIDFSKIILEKGDFSFDIRSCRDFGKVYYLTECSLVGISETVNLDGNATIDFNYVSSVTQNFLTTTSSGPEFSVLGSEGWTVFGSDEEPVLS